MAFQKNKNSKEDLLLSNILPSSSRSQSEVVSTVLMILISVIAITIIAVFVVNFVKNKTESSKCFDVLDMVEIENNPTYNCYDNINKVQNVQVHFSQANLSLDGFKIEIGGADTKGITITRTSHSPEATMYENPTGPVELPGDNEERTYKVTGISTKPDILRVYPILKGGKICQSSGSMTNIGLCA